MRLILIRHGKAEKESDSGRDEDRELLPRGRRQSRYLADELTAGKRMRPRRLLASGFTRARQTAQIIAAQLDLEVEHAPVLEIGHGVAAAIELIEKLLRSGEQGPIAFVGHNPQLEHLAGVLLHGPTGMESMRTGEAVILDLPDSKPVGRAELVTRLRLAEDD